MSPILAFIWLSLAIPDSDCEPQQLESRQEESRQFSPRGYGYAHPFLPFLEPLSILAVLGFIAFVIQTVHAIYHTHNSGSAAGLGGLLGSVLPNPALHKKLQSEGRRSEDVFKAIQFYEELNKGRRRRKRGKIRARR